MLEVKKNINLEEEEEVEHVEEEKRNYLPIVIESSSFENLKPNSGREKEYFVLKTDIYNQKTFSIKIRAIDFSNNAAPWSQILTVKINPKISLSAQLRHYSSDSIVVEKKDPANPRTDLYSNFFVGFVVGLSLILLVQLVFFIIIIFYKIKQMNENKLEPVRV